jgi:hypothetical protein
MANSNYTNGIAAFVNLLETDKYNGQDTGKFSITLTMDEDEATVLENMGIKLKEYQGKAQRKFSTKYQVPVYDPEGNEIDTADLRYGSKVRLKWAEGRPHPVHGVSTYLSAVKVIEFAEKAETSEEF